MSSMTIGPIAPVTTDPSERSALLFWMIFTGLSIFAVVLLWRFGPLLMLPRLSSSDGLRATWCMPPQPRRRNETAQ